MCGHGGRVTRGPGEEAPSREASEEASEETRPADAWLLDPQPPELWETDISVVEAARSVVSAPAASENSHNK